MIKTHILFFSHMPYANRLGKGRGRGRKRGKEKSFRIAVEGGKGRRGARSREKEASTHASSFCLPPTYESRLEKMEEKKVNCGE